MSIAFDLLPLEQRMKVWQILEERNNQDAKWGVQNHNDLYWLGILVEEIGELAREIIEGNSSRASRELTQIAAVALAWMECKYRKAVEDDRTRG